MKDLKNCFDSSLRLIFAFLLFLSASNCFSQKKSLFDSLYQHDIIRFRITYPFDSLYKFNNEEISARITIETEKGTLMNEAPLSINLRGKFRRMKCTMPPLMLNFKKSLLKEMKLVDHDEIKLVTHCLDGDEGIQNLQEELLAYQIYESITPYSYRTIWISVIYCDAGQPDSCVYSAGLLLEPDKDIAKRLDVKERKLFNLTEDSIHYESYVNTGIFNFLIGNRDWSVQSSRNAKLFYSNRLQKYIVVPYDFDYSNLVGASYRRDVLPSGMSHPFDRIYEGEYFKEMAGRALKEFSAKENAIIESVHRVTNPLGAAKRKKVCRYFSTWFDHIKKKSVEQLGYGAVVKYRDEL